MGRLRRRQTAAGTTQPSTTWPPPQEGSDGETGHDAIRSAMVDVVSRLDRLDRTATARFDELAGGLTELRELETRRRLEQDRLGDEVRSLRELLDGTTTGLQQLAAGLTDAEDRLGRDIEVRHRLALLAVDEHRDDVTRLVDDLRSAGKARSDRHAADIARLGESHAASAGEHAADIGHLGESLAALAGEHAAGMTRLDGVHIETADLARRLDGSVTTAEGEIARLAGSLEAITAEQAANVARLDEVSGEIGDLARRLDESVNAVQVDLSRRLDESVSAVQVDLSRRLDESVGAAAVANAATAERLADLTEGRSGDRAKFVELDKRLAAIERSMAERTDFAESLHLDRLEELERMLSEVNPDHFAPLADLRTMRAELDALMAQE